ncbi:uncharacterized protein VTP21DRAFT_6896 [Calcarisporiella thermophila]|uniref:uncharacterized protein n=1 Tax=Calcarisporiella thermophila TaxID=911321 RepID=UPI003743A6ED
MENTLWLNAPSNGKEAVRVNKCEELIVTLHAANGMKEATESVGVAKHECDSAMCARRADHHRKCQPSNPNRGLLIGAQRLSRRERSMRKCAEGRADAAIEWGLLHRLGGNLACRLRWATTPKPEQLLPLRILLSVPAYRALLLFPTRIGPGRCCSSPCPVLSAANKPSSAWALDPQIVHVVCSACVFSCHRKSSTQLQCSHSPRTLPWNPMGHSEDFNGTSSPASPELALVDRPG